MARRQFASYTILWERHEKLYIEVFSEALKKLTIKDCVTGDENVISETLCLILSKICFNMKSSKKNIYVRTPIWEQPIQPVTESELKGGKNNKRPDFTCNCNNSFAINEEESEIPFHIECKRIGTPSSAGWNLNKNYVEKGIARFDSSDHEYGKRAPSGLVIGYIIDMRPDCIQTEINSFLPTFIQHFPLLSFPVFLDLSRTTQLVHRTKVTPSDFKLHHLWVDIRHNYVSKSIPSSTV